MTEQEIHRAVKYVIASTSYGRETVAQIMRMAFAELANSRRGSSRALDRETSVEYVCQWTSKQSGHPEPLVREVLSFAGQWLEAVYQEVVRANPGLLDRTHQE